MDYLKRFLEYAPQAYAAIRDADDVAYISHNTRWKEYRIQRVKDHVFYNLHQLDDRVDCFDPDPDIADAWIRLQQGNFTEEDLRLLEHEYFESRFERIFRTNYSTAHKAALSSGRVWNPPLV
ncbi:MAG TPA: hypothetical protein VK203_30465 [Nostocaceae cyanobacterium]|nr:hypothetical protein [Nostocaceae cyanobacterium]